ncbi:putative ABC exporter domain-containing protein, partial [Longimicrobium sp.]|uniref:putative ABC exporter domain-containing protein n=1 Tax=Longimicrobium sp. TaxID=2029185 RepID=UPI002E352B96
MNPGLRFLLRASVRGFFRRTGRRMRTLRGFVSTVFGVLLFVVLIGTQVMAVLMDRTPSRDHGGTVMMVSVALMVLLVPSLLAADAPFFWPHEVQFLFPAPLTRRELLLYQVVRSGWVQALSGLWVGLMGMRAAIHPLASLATGVLAMTYLFVLTSLVGLAKLALGDRLPPRARTVARPVLALGAVAAAFAFYRRTQAVGLGDAVGEAFASTWMRVVTLPTRPLGEAFAARTWGEALAWMAACAGLIGITAAATLAMDVDFRERSLVSSARRFERLRRMRASRAGFGAAAPARRRLRVPAFGFLGPAAPLARRQVYELGRGLRTLWSLLFTAVLAFFYVIVMPSVMNDAMGRLGITLVVLVIVFPLLASGGFAIDFRRDLERMAYLRSLPVRPLAVAVGQVFTSAAIIALVNVALLVGAAALADWRVRPEFAILAAVGAIPVAWLAVTLENWLFLLFPTRTQADGGQQNAFMGKQIVKLLFKLIVLGLVALAAAGVAVLGSWLGGSLAAAAGVVL